MERSGGSGFVVNGGIRMPIGYRFQPTDEELVIHYLKRKACDQPLPASVIPVLDVFQSDPWNLPGNLREKRYFFNRESGNECEIKKRGRGVSGLGCWKKVTGKDRPISTPGTSQVVGVRTTLIFRQKYQSSMNNNITWFMHKYCLLDSPTNNPMHKMGKITASGNWVVYRVYQKKKKKQKRSAAVAMASVVATDFTVEDCSGFSPPKPSSPSSSETTELISFSGFDL